MSNTTYEDSKESAIKVLVTEAGLQYEGDVWGIPDPGCINGVWLLILEGDTIGRQSDWRAFIVYINDQTFEEMNVAEAIEKHGDLEIEQRYKGNNFGLSPKEEY